METGSEKDLMTATVEVWLRRWSIHPPSLIPRPHPPKRVAWYILFAHELNAKCTQSTNHVYQAALRGVGLGGGGGGGWGGVGGWDGLDTSPPPPPPPPPPQKVCGLSLIHQTLKLLP